MTRARTMAGPDHARRLSELLRSLDLGQDTTIGALADVFGTHAFGATMFLFAAPNLVPNPPGTSPILGLPLLLLALQLLFGRRTIWLPQWLRRRPVSRRFLRATVGRLAPLTGRIEAAVKPRLDPLVRPGVPLRLVGAAALPLALILLLPLPFLHMLPGAAMTALAVGLAERDGLSVIVGYGLALVTLVTFLVLGWTMHGAVTSLLGGAAG